MEEFDPEHKVVFECYWHAVFQQCDPKIKAGDLTQHQKRVSECYYFEVEDPEKRTYRKITLNREMILRLADKIKEIESCFEERKF